MDDYSVVKECRHAIRSIVSFDVPDEECGDLTSGSDEDKGGEGGVWPTSGCNPRHNVWGC